ncbi:MAG: TrmH family RNA methyltransferase [Candidatus Dormibacteraceae bacterium]
MIEEAVRQGAHLTLLAVAEGLSFDALADVRVRLTSRSAAVVGTTVTTQGIVAIAHEPRATVTTALGRARAAGWPLVVLDAVQDPGNVGAICRTAAAAGAPAVVLLDGSADAFGAKAVRAAAGATFGLAVARGTWDDLRGCTGYGAVAHGGEALEACPLEACDLLCLGSEVHGLRRSDLRPLTIPMAPGVESLNVAAAAAVLLFEFRRRLAVR